MPDLPSLPSAQAQFTNETGRATREFFGFLQRLLSWANQGQALQAKTVTELPDAAESRGQRYLVTDATATTYASVVAGGGPNVVPVFSSGANWHIG